VDQTHMFTVIYRCIHRSHLVRCPLVTSGMARFCTLRCTEHDSERTGPAPSPSPAKHANAPSTPPGHPRPPLARPRTTRPISGRPCAHMRCFPRCVLRATASHSAAFCTVHRSTRLQRKARFRCCFARSRNLVLGQLAAPQLAVRHSWRRGGWRQPCFMPCLRRACGA
jgi:hypothetical protein